MHLFITLLISFSTALLGTQTPYFYRQVSNPNTQRIISLSPVNTEIIFALGLEKKVVGVTTHCDRPQQALSLPKIGSGLSPQLEKILSLQPDLIISTHSTAYQALFESLQAKKIPILVTFSDTLDDIRASITAIGKATQKEKSAQTLLTQWNRQMEALHHQLPIKASALFVIALHPLIVAGKSTFIQEAWKQMGGASPSLPQHAQWPIWSLEKLALSPPHFIIATQGPDQKKELEHLLSKISFSLRKPIVISGSTALFNRPGVSLPKDMHQLLQAILTTPHPSIKRKK